MKTKRKHLWPLKQNKIFIKYLIIHLFSLVILILPHVLFSNLSHVPGAFLIPYFIMLFLCGIPLLFMEFTVGQYTRLGPVHALAKICPLFKGEWTMCPNHISWVLFFLPSKHSTANGKSYWFLCCIGHSGISVKLMADCSTLNCVQVCWIMIWHQMSLSNMF